MSADNQKPDTPIDRVIGGVGSPSQFRWRIVFLVGLFVVVGIVALVKALA
jgi:hypothetical protein